jgi:hypothetical protein
MKRLLCYCLAGLLASCATTKPLATRVADEQNAERHWQPAVPRPDSLSGPRAEPGSQADFIRSIFEGHPPVVQLEVEAAPDSLPFVKVPKSPQKPTEKRRLFGLLPPKKAATAAPGAILTAQNAAQLPRKCKGCTFNVVAGNQDNQHVAKNGQLLGAGASNTQTGKKSGDIIKADSGAIVNKVGGAGNAQTTRGNNNTPQLSAPVQQAADWKATLAKPVGIALVLLLLFIFYKRRKSLSNNG